MKKKVRIWLDKQRITCWFFNMANDLYLSKREQQIMEIVYQKARVTASELVELMGNQISNSAMRTHLRTLERKGHLHHLEENGKYVYEAKTNKKVAAQNALTRVINTFYENSVEKVMSTLLSAKETNISMEELDRLESMIKDLKSQN